MPRSDAKLKNLPPDLQAEMWRLLSGPVDAEGKPVAPADAVPWTAEMVLDWLEVTHRVTSSTGAFSDWRSWYPVSQRLESARSRSLDLMEELRKSGEDISEEEIMRMGQVWFSLQSMEDGDAKVFEAMYRLRLKEKDQENEGRRIKLLEENAAKAKAELQDVVKKSKGGLTEETLKRIEEAANLL